MFILDLERVYVHLVAGSASDWPSVDLSRSRLACFTICDADDLLLSGPERVRTGWKSKSQLGSVYFVGVKRSGSCWHAVQYNRNIGRKRTV